ncbi:hypothetical protein V1389_01345 [Flavobacterium rakeshii]|uniref:hypothetical protein n=1 Tax=Flavobacterium rakeshii TaxID=1038845 RepID=UPI002E7B5966|nr:hypothetical protein [Flavobacterium rakeshii]MEE1896961.1 hypothetical protein [Flavobacterium rakeshii]
MKPTVKDLIEDIEEYIPFIKELSPKDHLKVYRIYLELHERCYNLNEQDFSNRSNYLFYLQQTFNHKIDSEHAEGLKNGIGRYINNNFMLTVFELAQMPTVIRNWVGKTK